MFDPDHFLPEDIERRRDLEQATDAAAEVAWELQRRGSLYQYVMLVRERSKPALQAIIDASPNDAAAFADYQRTVRAYSDVCRWIDETLKKGEDAEASINDEYGGVVKEECNDSSGFGRLAQSRSCGPNPISRILKRGKLLEKVRRGELTPDAAEAEAADLGLGKLSTAPKPSRFSPMNVIWWTMPMAVAWIAWRSLPHVRELWDTYRRRCWDWHGHEWRDRPDGPVRAGHSLERRRLATFSLLSLRNRRDQEASLTPDRTINLEDAKRRLWKALRDGAIQAIGINITTGERVTIIANHSWRNLEEVEESGKLILRPRDRRRDKTVGYEDVVIRRQALMSTWPPYQIPPTNCALPALMKPDGAGYMPLYCAAHWIVTRGGTSELKTEDVSAWQNGFEELTAQIASEAVAVTGLRDGTRERLPGHIFAGIPIYLPFSDTSLNILLSEELYLRSCVYIDDELWQRGSNDSLRTRHGCKWSKLMVLKSDVARHWPFSMGAESVGQTGAPGRPTSMHLVEAEYRARWDRGEAETTIGAEAKKLVEWLQSKHPGAPRLKPKTIENRLRGEHRKRIKNVRN